MGGSCNNNNNKSKGARYSEEFQALLDRLEEEDSYEYEDEEEEDDNDEQAAGGAKDGRRRRRRRRRKLTADQVRSLEAKFEAERRLGPARKAAIAAELGMEPRQVAVWFQNRRARCKTKQLEREFSRLQAGYDALRRDYDSLDKETKSLLAEVKDLEAKIKARNIGFDEQMGSYVNMGEATTMVSPEMMQSLMDVDCSPPLMQPLRPRDDAYIVDQPQSGFFVNGPGEGGVTSSSTWDVFSFDQSTFF